jgi:hypothetical protein
MRNSTKRQSAVRPVWSRRATGFTLVEVMISVTMVLLLIYGVAQVFKLSADAMGANQALSAIIRDHRAGSATLAEDFRNCVPDSPLFLISSTLAYQPGVPVSPPDKVDGVLLDRRGGRAGYKSAAEERQIEPAINRANDWPFNNASIFLRVDDRNPRLDRLAFFARGLYRRQAGGTRPLTTSNEAYIWYGHTALQKDPDKPAAGSNSVYGGGVSMVLPENQYVSERILGRVAILMKHAGDAATPWVGGTSSLGQQPPQPPAENSQLLWPLAYDNGAFRLTAGVPPYAPGAVPYGDISGFSVEDFRVHSNRAFELSRKSWFRTMEDQKSSAEASSKYMRFFCDPTVRRPLDALSLASSSRFFMGRVTQFAVEYAGDYLDQDPTTGDVKDVAQKMDASGNLTYGTTDGLIDFVVDQSAGTGVKAVRRVRWYGLPRDSNGDGHITVDDVVPLGDVMRFNAALKQFSAPWEIEIPLQTANLGQSGLHYPRINKDYANATLEHVKAVSPRPFKYTCAWHNDAPPMIRVLLKIDDATGKLQDGQWYEYVLTR